MIRNTWASFFQLSKKRTIAISGDCSCLPIEHSLCCAIKHTAYTNKQYIKNYEILAELYNSMDETLIYYMIKLIRSKLDTIDIIKLANYFYNNPNTDMSNDKFLWKSIQDYMYKTLYDDLGYKTKFVLDENYFENILLLSRIIITLLK